jgi:hypothetical protein
MSADLCLVLLLDAVAPWRAAASVAGFGPKRQPACNRASALAERSIVELGVNSTFTWHAGSLFQLGNLALQDDLLLSSAHGRCRGLAAVIAGAR